MRAPLIRALEAAWRWPTRLQLELGSNHRRRATGSFRRWLGASRAQTFEPLLLNGSTTGSMLESWHAVGDGRPSSVVIFTPVRWACRRVAEKALPFLARPPFARPCFERFEGGRLGWARRPAPARHAR